MNAKTDLATVTRALDSVASIITHAVMSVEPDDPLALDLYAWCACRSIPCTVVEFDRIDGGQMRSRLFEEAYAWIGAREVDERPTHLLNLDADDEITIDDPDVLARIGAAAIYTFTELQGDRTWQFPRLYSVDHTVTWRYPLHEIPVCSTANVGEAPSLPGIRYLRHYDPNRTPAHYAKHVELIQAWRARSAENSEDTRMRFYLAQSAKDAGQIAMAIDWYRKRSHDEGGYAEEAWYSALEAARLMFRRGDRGRDVEACFTRAMRLRPWRAEAYVFAAEYWRDQGVFRLAYAYGCAATSCGPSAGADRLFVDRSCYGWRAWDERSVAAQLIGENDDARKIMTALLHPASGLPADQRERVEKNLTFVR